MKKRARIELNITPIIDIVFILFTFFLVATSFKNNEVELDITLPSTSSYHKYDDKKSIKVSLAKEQISIDNKIMKYQDFNNAIKGVNKSKVIELKIDKNVKYQKISGILDILKSNDLNKISLVTKNKN